MQLNDYVKITEDSLDLNAIVGLVTDPKAGAVSTFLGVTRDNFNGKKVIKLEYEVYEPMAVKELTRIAGTIREKWNVIHIALHHRIGMFVCLCVCVFFCPLI
jgi:molybdopterin synthase catalytic subunit